MNIQQSLNNMLGTVAIAARTSGRYEDEMAAYKGKKILKNQGLIREEAEKGLQTYDKNAINTTGLPAPREAWVKDLADRANMAKQSEQEALETIAKAKPTKENLEAAQSGLLEAQQYNRSTQELQEMSDTKTGIYAPLEEQQAEAEAAKLEKFRKEIAERRAVSDLRDQMETQYSQANQFKLRMEAIRQQESPESMTAKQILELGGKR